MNTTQDSTGTPALHACLEAARYEMRFLKSGRTQITSSTQQAPSPRQGSQEWCERNSRLPANRLVHLAVRHEPNLNPNVPTRIAHCGEIRRRDETRRFTISRDPRSVQTTPQQERNTEIQQLKAGSPGHFTSGRLSRSVNSFTFNMYEGIGRVRQLFNGREVTKT